MLKLLLKKRRLDKALAQVQCADDQEINQIISAILHRYRACYPDYETVFLTLPRNDPAERKRIVDALLDTLERLNT